MKRIFLVDTENVNITALSCANQLSEEDLIILFVTKMTSSCSFNKDNLDCLNTKARMLKINVETGVKNSLDFQLVTCLGLLIGANRNEDDCYYIVSKDNGFLSSISLLQNCTNYEIELIGSLNEIFTEDMADMLIEKFMERGFKSKTATKMAFLTMQSKTSIETKDAFYNSFGNPDLYKKSWDIVEE